MDGACRKYGGEYRCIQGFSGQNEGRGPLEDLGVDGRIILKWNLEKWNVEAWTASILLRVSGNEPPGSIKCRNFLTSVEPFSISGRTLLNVDRRVELCYSVTQFLSPNTRLISAQGMPGLTPGPHATLTEVLRGFSHSCTQLSD
jgi:hypothetical protein